MHRALVFGVVVAAALVTIPGEGQAQKKQRDLITREELMASPAANGDAYAAINSLRPHFFQAPRNVKHQLGGGETYPLAIYFGRVKQSGIEDLQQLMVSRIKEIRYYDPARAQNEFGKTANGGAVMVVLATEKRDSTDKSPR